MGKSKTNIEWLRQVIEKSEKTMDADEYKEAIEFLDAVQEDMDDLKKESEDKDDTIKSLESDIDDKQGEINDLENQESDWITIQAGIGTIEWQSDNLQLQTIMEALGEKISSVGVLKVLRLLEVRPKVSLR